MAVYMKEVGDLMIDIIEKLKWKKARKYREYLNRDYNGYGGTVCEDVTLLNDVDAELIEEQIQKMMFEKIKKHIHYQVFIIKGNIHIMAELKVKKDEDWWCL